MEVVEPMVKSVLLVGALMTAAAYLVLLERWMAAWVQDRLGPNRVGIPLTNIRLFGLGQPLADGLKMIFKEEFTPAHVERRLFVLAPLIIMTAALAIFAVIPFGSVTPPVQLGSSETARPIELVVAPGVDVGMLYVFAVSSIAVYGVILGGWASNNKFSFLGGLRSSAQLIAYELPLGLGILGVVLASGSLRLDRIISDQAATGVWNIVAQPLGFVVFAVASFAEAARLPFDLPEAEQELIGGYHTEYGGMKLLLFLIGEFLHMVTASFLIVILFFGGWHLWGITGSGNDITWTTAILRIVVLAVKIFAVIMFFMLVRWSWPRFRFDQLMALAWKVMLPLGLVNLVLVAIIVELRQVYGREGRLDGSHELMIVLGTWIVSILAYVGWTILMPLHTDNRPRLATNDQP
jgi:NADH-quinone oxidoreductase subunit H